MTDTRFAMQVPGNAKAVVEFIHSGEPSAICAYKKGERCRIILRLSRNIGAVSCEAIFFDEYIGSVTHTVNGSFSEFDCGYDIYSFDCTSITKSRALSFFYFKVTTNDQTVFIKRGKEAYATTDDSRFNMFQLTVSDFAYEAPEKMYGGIIYHVFVDRFRRGGDVPVSDGAVLVSGEWKNIPEYPEYPGAPMKNNTFYGGTLYGIIEKLDYIASLGTTAIYLSPIFSSPSNHKYDTADYMTVDEMFGGDEALEALIEEAKKRNIVIILDGVFNHTGDDSIYFNKYSRFDTVGAYNSKKSPYYPWFDFQHHPDKYTSWWGISILPRINPDISECGEYLAGEGGVIDKYRKMGVYGFRLDVADELSDNFISKIKERLSQGGESILYGEVWEDASNKIAYDVRKKYYLGNELDGVMNYPVRVGLIDYIVNKGTDKLEYALSEVLNNMPPRIRNAQMNLFGSHDTVRIITALSGIPAGNRNNAELRTTRLSPSERKTASSRLMSAYTILATLPGVPSIFYGDEVGLEGYSDPFCRMPYPWGKEDKEILNHYKKVGAIRRNNTVYREGDFKLLEITKETLLFARYDKNNAYITAYNNSDSSVTLNSSLLVCDLISEKRARSITLNPGAATVIKANKSAIFEIVSEESK